MPEPSAIDRFMAGQNSGPGPSEIDKFMGRVPQPAPPPDPTSAKADLISQYVDEAILGLPSGAGTEALGQLPGIPRPAPIPVRPVYDPAAALKRFGTQVVETNLGTRADLDRAVKLWTGQADPGPTGSRPRAPQEPAFDFSLLARTPEEAASEKLGQPGSRTFETVSGAERGFLSGVSGLATMDNATIGAAIGSLHSAVKSAKTAYERVGARVLDATITGVFTGMMANGAAEQAKVARDAWKREDYPRMAEALGTAGVDALLGTLTGIRGVRQSSEIVRDAKEGYRIAVARRAGSPEAEAPVEVAPPEQLAGGPEAAAGPAQASPAPAAPAPGGRTRRKQPVAAREARQPGAELSLEEQLLQESRAAGLTKAQDIRERFGVGAAAAIRVERRLAAEPAVAAPAEEDAAAVVPAEVPETAADPESAVAVPLPEAVTSPEQMLETARSEGLRGPVAIRERFPESGAADAIGIAEQLRAEEEAARRQSAETPTVADELFPEPTDEEAALQAPPAQEVGAQEPAQDALTARVRQRIAVEDPERAAELDAALAEKGNPIADVLGLGRIRVRRGADAADVEDWALRAVTEQLDKRRVSAARKAEKPAVRPGEDVPEIQVVPAAATPPRSAVAPPAPAGAMAVRLPEHLAGAKPNYSFGSRKFQLTFEDDLDRAAYIAAGTKPSKKDADYVRWVAEQTGLSTPAIRAFGQKVKGHISTMAREAPEELKALRVGSVMRPLLDQGAAPRDRSGERGSLSNRPAIEPVADLTPEQRAVETVVNQRVAEHLPSLMEEYRSRFPNRINTDDIAELFPEYQADRTTHRPSVTGATNVIRDHLYETALKEQHPKLVVVTAGGPGAGKSVFARKFEKPGSLVYDSAMTNFEHGRSTIDAALDSGAKSVYVYVGRELADSFNATLDRAMNEGGGRTVPADLHVRMHRDAAGTTLRLAKHYANDARVRFRFAWNEPGPVMREAGPEVAEQAASPERYHGVEEVLNGIIRQRELEGSITPAIAAAARRRQPGRSGGLGDGPGNPEHREVRREPSADAEGKSGNGPEQESGDEVRPPLFDDFVPAGAKKLAAEGMTRARWMREMLEEFGDRIQPVLKRVWVEAQRLFRDTSGSLDLSALRKAWDDLREFGRHDLKNLAVRNLSKLADTNTPAYASALRLAGTRGQVGVLMRSAAPAIAAALRRGGGSQAPSFEQFRTALVESRLRGVRARWRKMAEQARTQDVGKLFQRFEDGSLKAVLRDIEGFYNIPADLHQTAAALFARALNGDPAATGLFRNYVADAFDLAAGNVAEAMTDAEWRKVTAAPGFGDALALYRQVIEQPVNEAHARNEGIFSKELGPLGTYYPLIPDKEFDPSKVRLRPVGEYNQARNYHNEMATGLAAKYDTTPEGLRNTLIRALASNNRSALLDTLEAEGLVNVIPDGESHPQEIEIGGVMYKAATVRWQDKRKGRESTDWVVMPKWLKREMEPLLEKMDHDPGKLERFLDRVVQISLIGPFDAVFHATNVLGAVAANTPYIPLGSLAATIAGNTPLTKQVAAILQVLRTDPGTEESIRDLQEMAKLGLLPDKFASETYSRAFAELTGADYAFWDVAGGRARIPKSIGPALFGPKGLDVRARLYMYRLAKQLEPNGTVQDRVAFVNQLGSYTRATQGRIERFLKWTRIAPFYTAGSTMVRNGINAAFSRGPITRNRMVWRIAAALTGGAVGLTAIWALLYKQYTDKWPWNDPEAKLLEFPLKPEHRQALQALFGKKPGTAYVSLAMFNPLAARGLRAVGASGAFEARQLGGDGAQIFDAARSGATNAVIAPAFGPMPKAFLAGAAGVEPYIYSLDPLEVRVLRSRRNRVAKSIEALNPIAGDLFETVASRVRGKEDKDAQRWLRMVVDLGLPRLFGTVSNRAARSRMMDRKRRLQEKADAE